IANGATATCTITNDDQPATLIVKKVVINNNGGTKVATNFSFQVNGAAPVAFLQDGADPLKGIRTLTPLNAGTYSVTEPPVSGYTTTYSNCSNVTIANGATATCTITNDDQPATLIVKKVVINNNTGTKVATDFSFRVNGGPAVAFLQDGTDPLKGIRTRTVNAGTYTVTEPPVTGYSTTYSNCSNLVIPNGGTATCTITNDDILVATGKITPTQTSCQDYVSRNAADLNQVNYSVKNLKISQTDPGVFFYYSNVRAPSSSFAVNVNQIITTGNFSTFFQVLNDQVVLYNPNCTKSSLGTFSYPSSGQVLLNITGATVGQRFVIGIKYSTNSLVGATAPNPSTVHYSFTTSIGANVVDADANGLDLRRKT
ncbi:MAG: hypothetical protein ABR518_06805, partial [Actinomycetota bacterium]